MPSTSKQQFVNASLKNPSTKKSSSSTPPKAAEMPPDVALRLFREGATFVFLNVPVGTEIGIDLQSWNVGEKFRGIKMIPPGLHFLYFRYLKYVSKMRRRKKQPDYTNIW